jgi:hypothetical protein
MTGLANNFLDTSQKLEVHKEKGRVKAENDLGDHRSSQPRVEMKRQRCKGVNLTLGLERPRGSLR